MLTVYPDGLVLKNKDLWIAAVQIVEINNHSFKCILVLKYKISEIYSYLGNCIVGSFIIN